jgi:membrane fusion protein, multidrug efflux system
MALACVVVGCGSGPARRSARIPILVARAERRTVPYEIEGTGTVEPIQTADVTAQVDGLITRVAFREGDEVRAGQTLFQIDPRAFEAAAERAAAVVARDRAQAETARLDLIRAEALGAQQLIAPGDLDQKRATWSSLASTARADSAALVGARLDLANATVRAPVSGKSGGLRVHVGDVAKANETTSPLVTIHQIRPIRVRFTIPQSDLDELRRQQGRALRVDAAPAERDSMWIEGSLAFIDNQVDAASGTVLLKAEFANRDGALWPGAFVRVRLRLYEQRDATVVPTAAVSSSQSGTYLYVVKADTTVETRTIEVRRTYQNMTVIASGVQPGETVVTDGQLRLSPGAKAVIRATGGASSNGATAGGSGGSGAGR